MAHRLVPTALLGGALLGLSAAGACDEGTVDCSDATTPDDCKAIALQQEGHQCGWVTVRRFAAGDACAVEAEHEQCVEFEGTEAGCTPCGTSDDVGFASDDPSELIVTDVCGPRPIGWRLCSDEPGSTACTCQGC